MNWRENIEAQIASLRNGNYIEWTDDQLANYLQALLGVSVAAEEARFCDCADSPCPHDELGYAIDKLREVE